MYIYINIYIYIYIDIHIECDVSKLRTTFSQMFRRDKKTH